MFCAKKVAAMGIFLLNTPVALAADLERSIQGVESQSMVVDDFRLQNGKILPKLRIAYETYGTLDASKRNVILVTHGYMGSHHAAGVYRPGKAPIGVGETDRGWWDSLIGPGKAIDTNRFFIISSNMLGSSYGTTNPASINPITSKPYGPDFPEITMVDIVSAQHRLLQFLGIEHLVAVAGWSYGGYLAFQWAVTYPSMMDGIVVAASSPKGSGNAQGIEKIVNQFAKDPNWNNGWYYDRGGINKTLTEMRIAALRQYGNDRQLADKFSDATERNEALRKLAQAWANVFDGHSLIVLRRAADYYDAQKDFGKIKAKVLYVLSTTDKLFPPVIAPSILAQLRDSGVDATYFELNSDKGHLAVSVDAEKWAPALRTFLEKLAIRTP